MRVWTSLCPPPLCLTTLQYSNLFSSRASPLNIHSEPPSLQQKTSRSLRLHFSTRSSRKPSRYCFSSQQFSPGMASAIHMFWSYLITLACIIYSIFLSYYYICFIFPVKVVQWLDCTQNSQTEHFFKDFIALLLEREEEREIGR